MTRNVLALGIAAALAVVAVVGLNRYLDRERQALRSGEEGVRVVVAATDLARGTVLRREHLRAQEYPARFVSGDHVVEDSHAWLVGARLAHPRKAAEPITWYDVQVGERGLAEGIPLGERAVAVEVDEVSGVAGMIRPNDRVDILGVFPDERGEGEERRLTSVVLTLFQNVTVLAAGESTGSGRSGAGAYRTVTLSVSPEEAERLALAREHGRLVLSLRNPEDPAMEDRGEVDLEGLLDPAAAAELLERRRARIRIYRGGEGEE